MVNTEIEARPFKFEVTDNGEFRITMDAVISQNQWDEIFKDNCDKPLTMDIQGYQQYSWKMLK